jgi:hypothetical protein
MLHFRSSHAAPITPVGNPELLITQGISECTGLHDPGLECTSAVNFTTVLVTNFDDSSVILDGCWILLFQIQE